MLDAEGARTEQSARKGRDEGALGHGYSWAEALHEFRANLGARTIIRYDTVVNEYYKYSKIQ
jgi:hypothetical protein